MKHLNFVLIFICGLQPFASNQYFSLFIQVRLEFAGQQKDLLTIEMEHLSLKDAIKSEALRIMQEFDLKVLHS
jgi:hypothetical protein